MPIWWAWIAWLGGLFGVAAAIVGTAIGVGVWAYQKTK